MSLITVIMWIIGIAVSVVFGIPSIISLFRGGKITFVKESSICLFDSVIKNFPPIKISYNNSPIAQNLVLIKGAIVNTGTKDITQTMVENDLEAHLPVDFKWLNIATVDSSGNLKAKIAIKDNKTLVFKFGLLRRKEFVRFEGLVEVPIKTDPKTGDVTTPKDVVENIVFTHRISDTAKVNQINLWPAEQEPPIFVFNIMFLIIIAGVSLIQLMGWGSDYKFIYPFNLKDNKAIEASIIPKKDNKVLVEGVKEKFSETMPIQEFLSKTNGVPRTSPNPDNKTAFTLYSIFFGIIYGVILLVHYKTNRNQNLRRILNI